MNDNAAKCLYNGATVYGYDGFRNERYRINEEQAAVVRQIFRMYADGYSLSQIVRRLNDDGLRTESGRLFTINKMYNILKNEKYLGIYIHGDHRIPGGMPAIIDPDTWEKAQRMKTKTTRHYEESPVEYLLTGKVFCGHCGKPMAGDSGTSSTGAVYYYYNCQSRKRRAGCTKKPIRKEALEDAVISFLLDHVLSGPETEKIADAVQQVMRERAESSPLRAMESELRETERKISNTNRAIAEGVFSTSTIAMLHTLENTASSLRLSIESRRYAEGKLLDRDQILFFLQRFSHLDRTDPDDRKFLIRVFLNAVYVYDDRLLILVNATDSNLQVPLSSLPDDLKRSDSVLSFLPMQIQTNVLIVAYRVRM